MKLTKLQKKWVKSFSRGHVDSILVNFLIFLCKLKILKQETLRECTDHVISNVKEWDRIDYLRSMMKNDPFKEKKLKFSHAPKSIKPTRTRS